MLTGVHILLTYTCSYECDHCFLYCSPNASGTFTLQQLKRLFEEIRKIETIRTVYFEGGEAFLFYPLMVEGIRLARTQDLKVGIVTNGYWATAIEDAKLWLQPLAKLGISDLSVSNDSFHYSGEGDNPAEAAYAAADELGMSVGTIRIEEAKVLTCVDAGADKGEPVIGGNVKLRGRAVEKLTEGLPRKRWDQLTSCPHEELENPQRVHIDAYGNVHICQGLSMGNMWETTLSELLRDYQAQSHPICGPLVKGGPAALAREYGVEHEEEYVDECHFCYAVRSALLDRFPEYLTPRQVYGLE
jgi:hypothetical protein